MRVAEILKSKSDHVFTIRDDAPFAAVARAMAEARIGALVVRTRGDRLLGVISERDVVAAIAKWGASAMRRQVHELMIRAAPTVDPSDPVQHVMAIMTEARARHLLVVEAGRLVGLLSIGDVVKSRLTEKVQENRVLQEIAGWSRAA